MKVALNSIVSRRGISGSATAARMIQEALSNSLDVANLNPSRGPAGTRLGRLLDMYRWDFVEAPRQAAVRNCSAIIHTANVGLGRGLRTLIVVHDTMVLDHPNLFDPGFVKYARTAFGPSIRRADEIIVPSQHTAAAVRRRWPAVNPHVVPWPVREFAGDVDSTGFERTMQGPAIVVVASTDKHKRLPLAISAVQKVRDSHAVDLRLKLIIRPGNDHQRVVEAAKRQNGASGSRWVEFYEGISGDDLNSLLAGSFCILSTSLDEGFCLPLIEGAAHGRPVIHTCRGAMSEVIEPDEPNVLPPYLDEEYLVREIVKLLDRRTWLERAEKCLSEARRFTFSRFSTSWNTFFN